MKNSERQKSILNHMSKGDYEAGSAPFCSVCDKCLICFNRKAVPVKFVDSNLCATAYNRLQRGHIQPLATAVRMEVLRFWDALLAFFTD